VVGVKGVVRSGWFSSRLIFPLIFCKIVVSSVPLPCPVCVFRIVASKAETTAWYGVKLCARFTNSSVCCSKTECLFGLGLLRGIDGVKCLACRF
jgi:hypothetical protein